MTAFLSRLRIAGFKSFAEPVSLDILPGLTGIVGPNGCGKSNVVEALRWAMGETSARSLRGGEMDDVIFAGTTARASRNLAEVTITLDGALPAPFEAEPELQVTRRIERGAGSTFRINGREHRARDVQTLYADLASGARSSGMVSQGRVSTLVNARPEERRQVIEEAAGITGLHARRHEAELKLRAAEANLARTEDLRTQLDAAQEAMRKQARQAARYRTISGLIRSAEAEHLAVKLAAARAQEAAAEAGCTTAAQAAADAAEEAATSAAALAEAEAALPVPREAAAQAARSLERRRVEAERLAEEADRAAREAAAAEARLLELQADLDAAVHAQADAAASVERLTEESARLAEVLERLPGLIEAAHGTCSEHATLADDAQKTLYDATQAAQAASLATAKAQSAQAQALSRADALRDQHAAAGLDHAEGQRHLVSPDRLAEAAHAVVKAEADLADARATLEQAEASRAASAARHAETRAQAERAAMLRRDAEQAWREADARVRRLGQSRTASRSALETLLQQRPAEDHLARLRASAASAAVALEACETGLQARERETSVVQEKEAAAVRREADLRAAHDRASAVLAQASARVERLRAEYAAAHAAFAEATRTIPAADALNQAAQGLQRATEAQAACEAASVAHQAGSQHAAESLARHDRASAQASAEVARLRAEVAGLSDAIGPATIAHPHEIDPATIGLAGPSFAKSSEIDPSTIGLPGPSANGTAPAEDGAGPATATTPAATAGLLDALRVPDGLDAAVGVAIGDAAGATLHPAEYRFWRDLPVLPAPELPSGCVALATLVQAPPALARLLGYVALLPDGAAGDAIQPALAPGVLAVSREGGSWRWDGHVTRPGAPNAATSRLRQQRRLGAALSALAEVEQAARDQEAYRHAAYSEADEAAALLSSTRQARAAAEAALRQAQATQDEILRVAAQAEAQCEALRVIVLRLRAELDEAEREAGLAGEAARGLDDPAQAEATRVELASRAIASLAAVRRARDDREAARATLSAAQAAAQGAAIDTADIEARIAAAAPALANLDAEHDAAAARLAEAGTSLASQPDPTALAEVSSAAELQEAADRDAEARARTRRLACEAALDAARAAESHLRTAERDASSRLSTLTTLLARTGAEFGHAEADLADAQAALANLPDQAALAQAAQSARQRAEATTASLHHQHAHLAGLQASQERAGVAAETAFADLAAWKARHRDAKSRAASLAERRTVARQAWCAASGSPGGLAARAEQSAAALADAEAANRTADAELHTAEQRLRALAVAQRDADQRLSACREGLVRTEAARHAARAGVQAVLARAAERLGDGWTLPDANDTSDAAEERARRRFERLTRERDEMGPVNLRAELELAELDERLTTLDRDRDELGTAVAKLRGAIGHLNREGRERLQAVFTQVDAHFRTLFTRMMGGGRAHLALTGSDDPLLAGLEIYAEPPGKKLSSLALLSGGEQALTALSLIFAVFRCTPAPISVLDEVDAPLDDANVERFCTLLDDVVRDTGTRFLVVTHHQLTMSRMDRLFGVTMQERGVSRLLSVDLRRAVAMVEPALQAAE